jgi:hypothetical protein
LLFLPLLFKKKKKVNEMPSTNNFYSSARFKQKKYFEKASPEKASTDSLMGCAQAKNNYPQVNDLLSFQNISSLHKAPPEKKNLSYVYCVFFPFHNPGKELSCTSICPNFIYKIK